MTIEQYLTNLCQHTGLEQDSCQVEVQENEHGLQVSLRVPEDETGLFIGYKGETLAAIQRLLRLSFHETLSEKRLVLNINNYREERLEQLKSRAIEAAKRVVESGESYRFPYMSSYERYLIHTTLTNDASFSDKVVSHSEGEGKQRRLVIAKA